MSICNALKQLEISSKRRCACLSYRIWSKGFKNLLKARFLQSFKLWLNERTHCENYILVLNPERVFAAQVWK